MDLSAVREKAIANRGLRNVTTFASWDELVADIDRQEALCWGRIRDRFGKQAIDYRNPEVQELLPPLSIKEDLRNGDRHFHNGELEPALAEMIIRANADKKLLATLEEGDRKLVARANEDLLAHEGRFYKAYLFKGAYNLLVKYPQMGALV